MNIDDFPLFGPLQKIVVAARALQLNKDGGFMSFQTVTFREAAVRTVTFPGNQPLRRGMGRMGPMRRMGRYRSRQSALPTLLKLDPV
jgi:hypothetical protein